MKTVKLNANRTTPKTFANFNVQSTTAPPTQAGTLGGRTHARPTLVNTGGWTATDWALIGVLILAMFVLEAREA